MEPIATEEMFLSSYKEMDVDRSREEMEATKKKLFKECMAGNWGGVMELCTNQPAGWTAKISRDEDTVLHLAVSKATSDVVRQLIGRLPPGDEGSAALAQQNVSGNTPLHLAARRGLADVCRLLAAKRPAFDRIERKERMPRNKRGETPLFSAVRYGKEEAFFALRGAMEEDLSHCKRNDGNTILHIAIKGEYFDLAFEIIGLYPDLVNYHNERGETALHLLANKPLVFPSGSMMGQMDSFIYSSVTVDSLKSTYPTARGKTQSNQLQSYKESKIMVPENYNTCRLLFSFLIHVFNLIGSCFHNQSRNSCYIAAESSVQLVIEQESGVEGGEPSNAGNQREGTTSRFPEIYTTCFNFLKIVGKMLLVVLGRGMWRIEKIKRMKQIHTHARQVMGKLVDCAADWEYHGRGRTPYENNGIIPTSLAPDFLQRSPTFDFLQRPQSPDFLQRSQTFNFLQRPQSLDFAEDTRMVEGLMRMVPRSSPILQTETPVLIAAKMGIIEMVKTILETFPVAVEDKDSNHMNIVLLAVKHRQPHVYQFMLEFLSAAKESVFGCVDKNGNSALHIAAKVNPGIIPKVALQMQWAIKWYKFVRNSMEPGFFAPYNDEGETAREVFTREHKPLVHNGSSWLTSAAGSGATVATLIATVAYTSATTVPGDLQNGYPILGGQPGFEVFAVAALVALCFSVTSIIMFLSILTSHFQEMDFEHNLPTKLILGLISLFMSIVAMLVSFFAGHFYVLGKKIGYLAYPIYAITFFAVVLFPLQLDLIKATVTKNPERRQV